MIPVKLLCRAAETSCDIYVERCVSGYDNSVSHRFSLQFEQRMEKLKRKAAHPLFYQALNRVASILLCILISLSVWLAVDSEARAVVFGWIKGVYESFFVYHFEEASTNSVTHSNYRPTWLPEGYTEYYVDDGSDTILVIYTNQSGDMLKFHYVQNPNETDWLIDLTHMKRSAVKVNGLLGDLLISSSNKTASCILWSDADNTAFYISAFLKQADLIKIAESVQKIN